MKNLRLIPTVQSIALLLCAGYLANCGGVAPGGTGGPGGGGGTGSGNAAGVFMWKGDSSGSGLYANETLLSAANVTVDQFGRQGSFQADGLLVAQPLYVANLDMGQAGTHNVIIVATEHDSVYAIDADNP